MKTKLHKVNHLVVGNTKVLYACGLYGYVCGINPTPVIAEKQNDTYINFITKEPLMIEETGKTDDCFKTFNTPYLTNSIPFEKFLNEKVENVSEETIEEIYHQLHSMKSYIKK